MTAPPVASAHIIRAYQASGLSTQAFADWLRCIAKDIENVGERGIP